MAEEECSFQDPLLLAKHPFQDLEEPAMSKQLLMCASMIEEDLHTYPLDNDDILARLNLWWPQCHRHTIVRAALGDLLEPCFPCLEGLSLHLLSVLDSQKLLFINVTRYLHREGRINTG